MLRYFSSAILYPAPVASSSARNDSLVSLSPLSSSPFVVALRRNFRLSSFSLPRAHVDTIERESNEQNSVIFRRNERRPIRAWKARQQGEGEGTDTSTNRLYDKEARGCATRGISTYMASRRNICAIRESPQCVSSVAEIAGE